MLHSVLWFVVSSLAAYFVYPPVQTLHTLQASWAVCKGYADIEIRLPCLRWQCPYAARYPYGQTPPPPPTTCVSHDPEVRSFSSIL
ncbi:hypothetical protein PHLGIDRAFT_307338 [Phlebiopsis gigantea 11061_1 CR5-6]|uniref:Secreted protein n=1 Tax=Phlebiopsis gigantea (strain 11061_1 CR5-6) TaxID=745531 RepID=A0A0C3S2R1_PHLG1|nr:hypothetical protein PHLGIDRAFT_307338 [Phlebiopsis gigantea 11061_1 CR5-6]